MKDIKGYYIVEFVYEVDDDNYKCIERFAFIGVFSTKEKANTAVDYLMNQPGFRDHPRDCFYISFFDLDKLKEWTTGFVKLK